ncbi:MAG: dienelactone hydrolase family protein [Chloroflexota bacterium]|nr:dienelactone hydrolase family protein [Chloroflexota bacterium]
MPIYDPGRVEYATIHGRIGIVTDDGGVLPAYWAHPDMGGKFPAVAILHDWWGMTQIERRLANLFAGMGYYAIVPDLFNGKTARTPQEALELFKALGDHGYGYVDTALGAVEHHHRVNSNVAAIGLGMGGSLAYEAALNRTDLEAAVACYGFPGRYVGRFKDAKAPILAIYGANEPYIAAAEINRLRAELKDSPLAHEVVILDGVGREFFEDHTHDGAITAGKQAIDKILAFVETYVGRPRRNAARRDATT